MGKRLNITQGGTYRASNRTVYGVAFDLVLQHASVNTAIAATDYDPSKYRVGVKLRKKKGSDTGEDIVPKTYLDVLHMAGTFRNHMFVKASPVSGDRTWDVLVTQDATTKNRVIVGLRVYFKGAINVAEDEELVCTMDVPETGYVNTTNIDTTSGSSYVEVYTLKAEEAYEEALPVVHVVPVESASGPLQYQLPKGTAEVVVVTRLTSTGTSSAPFTEFDLNGHYFFEKKTQELLIGLRTEMFEVAADAAKRCQSHVIYSGSPLTEGGTLDVTWSEGNITANNKVYLVIYQSNRTERSIKLADARRTVNYFRKLKAGGVSLSSTQLAQLRQAESVKQTLRMARK